MKDLRICLEYSPEKMEHIAACICPEELIHFNQFEMYSVIVTKNGEQFSVVYQLSRGIHPPYVRFNVVEFQPK